MAYTIAVHNGKLVLIDDWQTQWDEPVQARNYWPTSVTYSEIEHSQYIGKECRNYAPGLYQFSLDGVPLFIALENRGATTAVHRETRPVPKPRRKTGGYGWKWSMGQWVLDY